MPGRVKVSSPLPEPGSDGGQAGNAIPPKPRTRTVRPWLTRLPALTPARRAFRHILKWAARLLVFLLAQVEVRGSEHFPAQGALILVTNHLGDMDAVVGLAYLPRFADPLAKSELYDFPFFGWLMDTFGVIWVHRGQPDRKAIRAALDGLEQGRVIGIAPEGRESLTGSLEEGTGGAAFLALQSGVPILPVTLTGTENKNILGNLKRFRRSHFSLTVGQPFRLEPLDDRREAVQKGTESIMKTLASQLPRQYQGVYQTGGEIKRNS